jgi:hypothetical protein
MRLNAIRLPKSWPPFLLDREQPALSLSKGLARLMKSTARFSRHTLKRVAESAEIPSDADSTDVFAALSPAVSD